MDPDTALSDLRQAIREYEVAADLPGIVGTADIAAAAERLHSAASALDDWISRGGFLPSQWQKRR